MQMVMCRACGYFVQAVPDSDTIAPVKDECPEPVKDECPECGGTEFKDVQSDQTLSTTEG